MQKFYNSLPTFEKLRPLIIIFAVAALFISLRIPFLNREYAPEEPLWVTAAEGVARTGYPLANLGETKINLPAYWKPPFLPIFLGLFYKLFGSGEIVSRSMPLVFAIGQLIIVLLLCVRIFGKERGRKIGLLTWLILAISPFAIQNNTYIETDGGILPFFILILIYNFWPILSDLKTGPRQWFLTYASAALAFASRFETSILIFVALVLTALFKNGFRKAIQTALVFALAICSFFVIYHAYNSYFGHPETTKQSVEMIVASLKTRSSLAATPESPLNIFTYFGNVNFGPFSKIAIAIFPAAAFTASFTIWLTLPLAIIFIISIFSALKSVCRKNIEETVLLILIATTIAPFALTGTGANWPRHVYIGFVLAIILASKIFWDAYDQNNESNKPLKWHVLAGVITAAAIIFSPAYKILYVERIRSGVFWMGTSLTLAALLAAIVLIFYKNKTRVFAFLLSVFFIFSAAIWIHDVSTSYTLTAYYGNFGYKDAAAFLRKNIAPGEKLFAVDTIGYYFGGKYYDLADKGSFKENPDWVAIYNLPAGRFQDIIRGKILQAKFGTVEIYRSSKED